MRGHVDAESLALYAEGLLSRGRTARVRAHLSGCAECGTTIAALTDVTTQLSHVPAAPVPSAVAARLDATLSAEAAGRAAGPAPAPAPRPPRRNPLWSPRALRILAATGVTLVVAGGAGYAVSQFSGSSSPSAGTSRPASSAAGRTSGHRSVQAAPNISPGGGHMVRPNTPSPSKTAFARTSTDYQRGTFAAQASQQLAEYTVPPLSGPGRIAAADVPVQVRHCIRQIAGGRSVLFVDLARYQQRPAIVIVLGEPRQAIAASYSCLRLHSAPLPVSSSSPAR